MTLFHIHTHERRYRVAVDDPADVWRVIQEKTGFKNKDLGSYITCRGKHLPPETPGVWLAFCFKVGALEICYRVDFKADSLSVIGYPDDLDIAVLRLLSLWGLPTNLVVSSTPYTELYAVLKARQANQYLKKHPTNAESIVAVGKPGLNVRGVVKQGVTFPNTPLILPALGVLYQPIATQTPDLIKLELRYELQGTSEITRFPRDIQELSERDIIEGHEFHLHELTREIPLQPKPNSWGGSPLPRWEPGRLGRQGKQALLHILARNNESPTITRAYLEGRMAELSEKPRKRGNMANNILNRLEKNGLIRRSRRHGGKEEERIQLTPRGEVVAHRVLNVDTPHHQNDTSPLYSNT